MSTHQELKIAFIGGGNMASALGAGLIGKRCGAQDVHVVDIDENVLKRWAEQGVSTASQANETLGNYRVWVFAVKPQVMKETVAACKPFLREDTLAISIAAGIDSDTFAQWLGEPGNPWTRLVRCMPNTPSLVGAGISGLCAAKGVSEQDRALAQQLLRAVGEVVWVDNDQQIDAVTALSGSGPAYVFLFLEALMQGGRQLGLSEAQARQLALATLSGATELASLSPEPPSVLRERVTSKGGTTAEALRVFNERDFVAIVQEAMKASYNRASELSVELSK